MLTLLLKHKGCRGLQVAGVLSLLLSPSRIWGQTVVDVVAKAGDFTPELAVGESFSAFRGSSDEEAPRISDDGTVFSEFRLTGTTGARDGGYAVFPVTGPGKIAVREGDPVPGLTGAVLIQPPTQVAHAADGSWVWIGSLSGTGINTSNDRALFRNAGSSFDLLAREGQSISTLVGGNSSFLTLTNAIQTPLAGQGGLWGFVQDGAIYRQEGGPMRRLMATGDSAGVDLTWRGLSSDARMAADGSLLAQAGVRLTDTSTTLRTYGLAAPTGAGTSVLLQETTSAPGSPFRVLGTNELRTFSVLSGGRFAAVMDLQPLESGFPTSALFVGGPEQATERALQFGSPVPGTAAGTVNNIFSTDASGPWIVAWVGVANDPNVGAAVMMRRFDDPAWSTVITNGQQPDDYPEFMVGGFSRLAVAADGTVALGASVANYPLGGTASNAGLFLYRAGKLTLPAYIGLTLASGDTIGSRFSMFRRSGTGGGGFYGEGRFLNASGQAVVRVELFKPGQVGVKDALLRITPAPLPKVELPYTFVRQGNTVVLEVNGRVGYQYTFEQSEDLVEWTPMEPPVDGTDVAIQFQATIQTSPSKRFFRVEESSAQ